MSTDKPEQSYVGSSSWYAYWNSRSKDEIINMYWPLNQPCEVKKEARATKRICNPCNLLPVAGDFLMPNN